MNQQANQHAGDYPADGHFSETDWFVIRTAQDFVGPGGPEALASLCQTYWYPVYAFVRRRPTPPDEAKDLTQDFFAHLLQNDRLKVASRDKGRFRSFLLTGLSNFLNNEYEKGRAKKRGGGQTILSLDEMQAEQRYASDPADPSVESSPELGFDRRWALAVVNATLAELGAEYTRMGQQKTFDAVSPLLANPPLHGALAKLAAPFGMSEGALRVALSRLRKRFGEMLREQVARTVNNPAEIEDELRYVLRTWASNTA